MRCVTDPTPKKNVPPAESDTDETKTTRESAATKQVPDDKVADEPEFKLSVTELGVGAVSAVAAAFLGSRLGVAGTLIGAAVGSIAVGVISTTLKAAVHKVKKRPRWVATSVIITAVTTFVLALLLVTGQELTSGTSMDGRPGKTTLSRDSSSKSEDEPKSEESAKPVEPQPSETPVQPTPEQTPVEPTVSVTPTPEPTPDQGTESKAESEPTPRRT